MRVKVLSLLIFLGVAGCEWGPQSSRGFSLPEGNASRGESLIAEYGCLNCHIVSGNQQDADAVYLLSKPVVLGGDVARSKTYADLVTSIINPSHKIASRYAISTVAPDGMSKMQVMNDVMTVTDLIDLVAYLQPKYKLTPYRPTEYMDFSRFDRAKDNQSK